jgi:hypothetical protein
LHRGLAIGDNLVADFLCASQPMTEPSRSAATTSALITSWGEHDAALSRVLALAEESLSIFDADLARYERSDNIASIQRFLAGDGERHLRIVVRDIDALRADRPRLWKLLETYGQVMTVFACPPEFAELTDSLLISDGRHALVRFHEEQPRSKTIIDDPLECKPYKQRFEDLVAECGEAIGTTTLGL